MKKCVVFFLALAFSGLLNTHAQRLRPVGEKELPYDWKTEARTVKLSESQIARLEKDHFLVSAQSMMQIFEAYTLPRTSVFITTDSLLYGFHVLFEESVRRLETANAAKLRRLLEYLWKGLGTIDRNMKLDPQLVARAKFRAQTMVGVALKLMAGNAFDPGPSLRKIIDDECARILAAREVSKPAWLGPPDRGFLALDYPSFKPRGFYKDSPDLSAYFRALKWLQRIPFRVERDDEFLAIMMMGSVYHEKPGEIPGDFETESDRLLHGLRDMVGVGDDYDLGRASSDSQNLETWKDLDHDRQDILERMRHYDKGPAINDQIRFQPLRPGEIAEPNYRVISAARLPDAVLFQKLGDKIGVGYLPSGLDVAAALGSKLARERVKKERGDALLKEIDASWSLFKNMRTYSHIDQQGEREFFYFEGSLYVRFLTCLATLLDEPDPAVPAFMKGPLWRIKSCNTALAGWSEMRHTWALQAKQNGTLGGVMDMPAGFVEPEPDFYSRFGDFIGEVRDLLYQAGAFSRPDELPHLDVKWRNLQDVTRRLEALAHKQLRGLPFSEEENDFIKGYGDRLGHIMFYESNSYGWPKDDAPRLTDVFYNWTVGKYWEVGVGRPRQIWVLYPAATGDILCQGAIMPYFEFASPSPLTDEEWLGLLDSDKRPPSPDWLRPLLEQ